MATSTKRMTQEDIAGFWKAVGRRITDMQGVPLLQRTNELAIRLYGEFGFEQAFKRAKLPEGYAFEGQSLPFVIRQRKKVPIRMTLPFGGSRIGKATIEDETWIEHTDHSGAPYKIAKRTNRFPHAFRQLPFAFSGILHGNHNAWDRLESEHPALAEMVSITNASPMFDDLKRLMADTEAFDKFGAEQCEAMHRLAKLCKTPAKLTAALRENGCEAFVDCIPQPDAGMVAATSLALRTDELTAGLRKLVSSNDNSLPAAA